MYIIVGLGNPGRQYDNTRHNVGFKCIDAIAEKNNINVLEKKHKAMVGKGFVNGEKVVLVKPLTFMNLSGESVREVVDFYKVDPQKELIVIYDDISLAVGALRIRKKGSAGGHNGIKNIIQHLGNENFERIRIGVGEKPAGFDLADYVLGHFTQSELKDIDSGIDNAVKAAELLVKGEIDAAMNQFN